MHLGKTHMAMAASALVAGCASTPEVRTLADQTGRYVSTLREGTAEFVAAQNRLNTENESRLHRIAAGAAAARAQVARQRLAWTSGAQRAVLETQALASSATAEDVVARLQPRTTQPATVNFAGGKGYSEAAEALVQVETKPDMLAVLRGLAGYAQQVRDSYAKLQEEAAAADDAATEKAGKQQDQAENGAATVPVVAVNPRR